MALAEAFERGREERSERELVWSAHENVTELLLVLESHLALLSTGDRFDGSIMLDALDYIVDDVSELYGERWPRSARHAAIHRRGAELYHRLDRALRDPIINRAEVVRFGYAYCSELRRLIAMERRRLSAAHEVRVQPQASEERHRARFEELTRRVGCGCDYHGSSAVSPPEQT